MSGGEDGGDTATLPVFADGVHRFVFNDGDGAHPFGQH